MVRNLDEDRATVRRAVGEIWEGILGKAPSGAGAGFFESGGNSLAAVKLLGEVEMRFGLDSLTPEELYKAPTFGEIVSTIERNVRA